MEVINRAMVILRCSEETLYRLAAEWEEGAYQPEIKARWMLDAKRRGDVPQLVVDYAVEVITGRTRPGELCGRKTKFT